MKRPMRDVTLAGFMLFAMFLGAGNVIFPPYVGMQTGSRWVLAALGFILTGAGLPLLGTLAVAKKGGDSNRLCDRAWPMLSKVLNILILFMIGPLFAIPRTAATTCEMSVVPFLPEGSNLKMVFVAVSAVFFILTYFLSMSGGKAMDAIGGVLSPMLIVFLFVTIVLSIVRPIGVPEESAITSGLFYHGVSSGYQTMDGIGSIVMGGAVASLLLDKGYSEREAKKMLPFSAVIAGVFLASVYGGYMWIGASGTSVLRAFTNRTAMLSHASFLIAGRHGQILLALIIFFACLTTSSGLVITFSDYFFSLLKGKISRRALTLFAIAVSFFISLIGVEGIISLSVPVLEVIYPLCIVLIILNLMGRAVPSDGAFRGALIGVMLLMPVLAMQYIPSLASLAQRVLNALPLGEHGFAYLPLAAAGFFMGLVHDLAARRRS